MKSSQVIIILVIIFGGIVLFQINQPSLTEGEKYMLDKQRDNMKARDYKVYNSDQFGLGYDWSKTQLFTDKSECLNRNDINKSTIDGIAFIKGCEAYVENFR